MRISLFFVVVYFGDPSQLHKPHLAAYYFHKALEANEREAGRVGGVPKEWRLADCRAALLRNYALAVVMSGGGTDAMDAAAKACSLQMKKSRKETSSV